MSNKKKTSDNQQGHALLAGVRHSSFDLSEGHKLFSIDFYGDEFYLEVVDGGLYGNAICRYISKEDAKKLGEWLLEHCA